MTYQLDQDLELKRRSRREGWVGRTWAMGGGGWRRRAPAAGDGRGVFSVSTLSCTELGLTHSDTNNQLATLFN